VEKEFVELTRDGRFTLYRALVSEQAYRRKETKNLVKRYYQNSVKSMIAALVREEGLSGTDLAEIEALVKKAGEKDAE
ncbi:MAG: BlaI/MecI/CopY family transcriptional regulator, partial [Ruthenibacterium sp.]